MNVGFKMVTPSWCSTKLSMKVSSLNFSLSGKLVCSLFCSKIFLAQTVTLHTHQLAPRSTPRRIWVVPSLKTDRQAVEAGLPCPALWGTFVPTILWSYQKGGKFYKFFICLGLGYLIYWDIETSFLCEGFIPQCSGILLSNQCLTGTGICICKCCLCRNTRISTWKNR